MGSVQPQGENLRKAVKWISQQRKERPDKEPRELAEEASIQFDLGPEDSEFLLRFVKDPET